MASLGMMRLNACLTAIGLLLSALVVGWYNGATTSFIWSLLYGVEGPAGITIAAVMKVQSVFGGGGQTSRFCDWMSTIGMIVGGWMSIQRALHFQDAGLAGFMATIACISLTIFVLCGLWDTVVAFTGEKAAKLKEAADHAAARVQAANEAFRQN